MSRVSSLLLLLLVVVVCGQARSKVDFIRALNAAKHPATGVSSNDANKLPENGFSHAASDADGNQRRLRITADDDDDDDNDNKDHDNNDGYLESDASKRRWGKYSLQAWGKRRWSATNSGAAWGKRARCVPHDECPPYPLSDDPFPAAKRRWSANSGMRAWGKRTSPGRRPNFHARAKRSISGDDFGLLSRHLGPPPSVKRQWRYTVDQRQNVQQVLLQNKPD